MPAGSDCLEGGDQFPRTARLSKVVLEQYNLTLNLASLRKIDAIGRGGASSPCGGR